MRKFNHISGVILAGGKNSRLGFPKFLLTLNGKRIIDIILEKFNLIFDEILIVTDDKTKFLEFKDIKLVKDLIRECGPLGGIYTGLNSISNNKAFFIACDMPFLHNDLIKRLVKIAMKGDYDVVIPCSNNGIEPLYGVYSKSILSNLKNSLGKNEFSVKKFLSNCNCKYIKSRPQESLAFFNINTLEDLDQAKSYINEFGDDKFKEIF